MEWGPWIDWDTRRPEVGDYVQVITLCICGKAERHVGLVLVTHSEGLSLAPSAVSTLCLASIERWCKGTPPASEFDVRTKVEEPV